MGTKMFRLKNGGLINRGKILNFSFNGKKLYGYEGDTLASALLANGKHLVGRSFKYHRPRGIFSAGSEEPSALIQLGSGAHTEPNIRATTVPLFNNLVVTSQNHFGPLEWDLMRINDFLSPFVNTLLLIPSLSISFLKPNEALITPIEPTIELLFAIK